MRQEFAKGHTIATAAVAGKRSLAPATGNGTRTTETGAGIGFQARASRMRFIGVWAARRKCVNPASSNTFRSRASPAWAARREAVSTDGAWKSNPQNVELG